MFDFPKGKLPWATQRLEQPLFCRGTRMQGANPCRSPWMSSANAQDGGVLSRLSCWMTALLGGEALQDQPSFAEDGHLAVASCKAPYGRRPSSFTLRMGTWERRTRKSSMEPAPACGPLLACASRESQSLETRLWWTGLSKDQPLWWMLDRCQL